MKKFLTAELKKYIETMTYDALKMQLFIMDDGSKEMRMRDDFKFIKSEMIKKSKMIY